VPYQTKAERERARWMTLTETLKRISESEACDQTAAVKEFRKVLADGNFRQFEIRWEDRVSRSIGDSGGLSLPEDTPASVDWNKARFRLKGDGAVLDKWTGFRRTKKGNPRWRKLLFLRTRVEDLRRLKAKPSSPDEKPQGDPEDRKKPGPIKTEQEIKDGAKRLFERGLTPETCGWEPFRGKLCKELGVSIDTRGYGLDTVQRAVKLLRSRVVK
jgi:hypothetical protein